MKPIDRTKRVYCLTCSKTIEEKDLYIHDGLGHKIVMKKGVKEMKEKGIL